MAGKEPEQRLEELRERIDKLDERIVAAINERAALVMAVRELKEQAGLAIFDATRESHILARLDSLNEGPLKTSRIQQIYRVLLEKLKA